VCEIIPPGTCIAMIFLGISSVEGKSCNAKKLEALDRPKGGCKSGSPSLLYIFPSGYLGMQSRLFDSTFPQYFVQIAVAK